MWHHDAATTQIGFGKQVPVPVEQGYRSMSFDLNRNIVIDPNPTILQYIQL